MEINALTYRIIGSALRIHTRLGPGLLESVYEEVLADDLGRMGLHIQRQADVPIVLDERKFEKGYRADLIVEGMVVLEIKSIERLAPIHFKQLLTYLRLAHFRVGLLLNFGTVRMRDGIKRVINGY